MYSWKYFHRLCTCMDNLEFLGLSSKADAVYRGLLQVGEATAKELSNITKLDRTTIYDVLADLEQRGLVYKAESKKVMTFFAHSPKNLLIELKQKEEKLKEILPGLVDLHRTSGKLPMVRIYSSEPELLKLYDSLLEIKELHSYDIVCSERDWLQMNPAFSRHYKKRRAEKGIKTRLVMETSPIAEARKMDQAKTLSETKLLPPAFSTALFSAGCYILPDRVIFISYRKEHVATEIFSKEITAFMQNIFNFLWKSIS